MRSSQTVWRVLALVYTFAAMADGFSNRNVPARKTVAREDLPTLEIQDPIAPPQGMASSDFYIPPYTLLRAGPVSFVRRLVDGKSYEQYVWKYMKDFKEGTIVTAQGNADAYLASPDDWAEQKYLEGRGKRDVYDYGKPLPTDRVVLSSIWGLGVTILFSRVFWQLLNGHRNLF